MFGWIPVVLMLFAILPPRRAVVLAYVAGWLFLPVAAFKIAGIPAYDKHAATVLPILLGVAFFDSRRLLAFRFRWWDIPMLVLCLCPILSSLSNAKGLYDGLSGTATQIVLWGVPYFIGRICFNDLDGLKELAWGVLIGGLIYVPLCLWEVRMSPQLHKQLYGYHQHNFLQHMRDGGYRPMVFMQSALMIGYWMASAAIVCAAGWRSGAFSRVFGVPVLWVLAALLVTTLLCKAMFAIVLMLAGLAIVLVVRRRSWPVLLVAALIPAYMTVRVCEIVPRASIVSAVASVTNAERTGSLEARLIQEDLFSEKAMQQPFFGWTGWDFFPLDEQGNRRTRGVDGLWTITLGTFGLTGLTSLTLAMLIPVVLFVRSYPVRFWRRPDIALPAAAAILLVLWMWDCLLNGMLNPIYVSIAGGLVGVSAVRNGTQKVRARLQAYRAFRRRQAPAFAAPASVRPAGVLSDDRFPGKRGVINGFQE
ncbi:MAG: O-antigen ligase domain-containing protein [Planctomycetota bacterium]|nr:O-antigen ligase domain-containing protein [Planctomycetota bacterium]